MQDSYGISNQLYRATSAGDMEKWGIAEHKQNED